MDTINDFFDNLVTICLFILILFVSLGFLFIIIKQVKRKIKSLRRRKNRRKRRIAHTRKKETEDL